MEAAARMLKICNGEHEARREVWCGAVCVYREVIMSTRRNNDRQTVLQDEKRVADYCRQVRTDGVVRVGVGGWASACRQAGRQAGRQEGVCECLGECGQTLERHPPSPRRRRRLSLFLLPSLPSLLHPPSAFPLLLARLAACPLAHWPAAPGSQHARAGLARLPACRRWAPLRESALPERTAANFPDRPPPPGLKLAQRKSANLAARAARVSSPKARPSPIAPSRPRARPAR